MSGPKNSGRSQEQAIYCIWWLEGEVNNGGFHQYFLNSSGDLYAETLSALEAIGANKTKALLERAAQIAFGSNPPTDRDKRIDVLEIRGDGLIEELSPLDDVFYRYEDNIEELVNAYLSNGT